MPSVSPEQHRTMLAAAHDPQFAAHMGIPHHVAVEYLQADQQRQQMHGLADAVERLGKHGADWGKGERR